MDVIANFFKDSILKVDGLAAMAGGSGGNPELLKKLNSLEKENKTLKKGKTVKSKTGKFHSQCNFKNI